jgi:hypothetical protein
MAPMLRARMTRFWPVTSFNDGLGGTPGARRQAYRALFPAALDDDFVEGLRAATNGGWALGPERFMRQIAKALGRRVARRPKGRARESKDERRQPSLL